MATTHTVVKGDTLWGIAEKYLGSGTKYTQLAAINNIPNPNLIYIGQVIKLTKEGGSSSKKSSNPTMATINQFGLQSNSEGTLFATWSWSRGNTENFEVEWTYDTGDGVWFIGNRGTTDYYQSTYSIPSNATRVKFRVKPISKTRTVNNKETSYWTASWSSGKFYYASYLPPSTPSVPSVKIDKYKLTAEIDNISATELRATGVQFQIVKNDTTVFNTGKATINTKTNFVSYSCNVDAGANYKVRCRSYKGSVYSAWTDFTSNEGTIPSAPGSINNVRATSRSSAYLDWKSVKSATSYDVEYTTDRANFDYTDQTSIKTNIESTFYEITGLETGQEYFFRVRAVNTKGHSAWSEIKSVAIGKDPAAPTTWSSTTTAIIGEDLTLYWVHNSEDGSSQTYSELVVLVNGSQDIHEIIPNSTEEDEKDLTSSYVIDTSRGYGEGAKIQWKVRTAGVTKTFGDWSVERTVDIYAPPTLELKMMDTEDGNVIDTLERFPFNIYALAGPNTQVPIGYNLTISANEIYETVDFTGNKKIVNKGEYVYSKHFDTNDRLRVDFSAGDVNLDNNISYTVNCVVSMNSGLTAEASLEFLVSWTDDEYIPNAEISFDPESIVTHIKPYCEEHNLVYYKVNRSYYDYVKTTDIIESVWGTPVKNATTETGEQVYSGVTDDGENIYYCEVIEKTLIEDVHLSVYRREFDGTFTELASDIDGARSTFITDPHPSLDYARYRIVAITNDTGAVSYYDVPGYPINETAIIIQWDEEWSEFDISSEDELEQPPWSGSLLRLPYNIDTSEKQNADVALIEYSGRKNPVSYYGTQIGESATWNVEIEKSDKDTLYALRRLKIWMGDVYVREPSGSGYWARIGVSFSQKHCELTIPVTLDITRVEGGI